MKDEKKTTILCKWCGSPAEVLYQDLRDSLGSAKGDWGILRCRDPLFFRQFFFPKNPPENHIHIFQGMTEVK